MGESKTGVVPVKGPADSLSPPDRDVALAGYLSQAVAGDTSALTALYDETNGLVYSMALRIAGQTADAEEITLDVFNHVWRNGKTYDPSRGGVRAWLIMLARSRALDRVRSRAGRFRRETPMPENFDVRSSQPDPEQETETARQRRRVRQALDELPRDQRVVLELAFFSGFTHSELADHLNEPLGTVKTRVRQGMMKLRASLGTPA
jgi:RNA polymerase sigma-70 factor (ECF subfamily)